MRLERTIKVYHSPPIQFRSGFWCQEGDLNPTALSGLRILSSAQRVCGSARRQHSPLVPSPEQIKLGLDSVVHCACVAVQFGFVMKRSVIGAFRMAAKPNVVTTAM